MMHGPASSAHQVMSGVYSETVRLPVQICGKLNRSFDLAVTFDSLMTGTADPDLEGQPKAPEDRNRGGFLQEPLP